MAGAWYSVPELRLRDHRFAVPLDYSLADSPKITVFAREVVAGISLDWLYVFRLHVTFQLDGVFDECLCGKFIALSGDSVPEYGF